MTHAAIRKEANLSATLALALPGVPPAIRGWPGRSSDALCIWAVH